MESSGFCKLPRRQRSRITMPTADLPLNEFSKTTVRKTSDVMSMLCTNVSKSTSQTRNPVLLRRLVVLFQESGVHVRRRPFRRRWDSRTSSISATPLLVWLWNSLHPISSLPSSDIYNCKPLLLCIRIAVALFILHNVLRELREEKRKQYGSMRSNSEHEWKVFIKVYGPKHQRRSWYVVKSGRMPETHRMGYTSWIYKQPYNAVRIPMTYTPCRKLHASPMILFVGNIAQ